jgi:hypothetical protein
MGFLQTNFKSILKEQFNSEVGVNFKGIEYFININKSIVTRDSLSYKKALYVILSARIHV